MIIKEITDGDANDDGEVNDADVDAVASYIMGQSPTGFNKEKADMNHDGEVNAVDLVEIVKIVNGKK
jgi:mono/diheme cytochrome c family protein